MKRIVLFFTVIAALTSAIANSAEKPLILSTIKPVHMLVHAISGDLTEHHQIIPDYASPHHYSLKPSDLRRLSKADLVFRIDPNMEAQLNKSLKLINEKSLITLSGTDGLAILETGHHHHNDEHEETNTDDSAKDYHLWLAPNNAILLSEAIRDAMIQLLPEHAAKLEKNTQHLTDSIQKTDREISSSLTKLSKVPFLVMHDAWQYFTHYYALNQLGSVSQQDGLLPSGKALSQARAMIRDSGVQCIVNEPGVKLRTLAVLTEDLDVKSTEIDPLGRTITLSSQSYPELLQYTATQLINCLKAD